MNSPPVAPVTFERLERGRLKIDTPALAVMLAYAQHTPEAPEAGGVLIGRWIIDTEDVVIDSVTVPGPADRAGRYHFHRAREHHQAALDKAWQLSGGSSCWLGEWHTHPERKPHPSRTDRAGWEAIMRRDRAAGDGLFFIIVGTDVVRVWEWRRGRQAPCFLELVPP